MSRTTTALLSAALVAAVAATVVVSGAVPVPGVATAAPELTSFDASAPTCTDEQSLDSAAEVATGDGNTTVIHVANVSLPHPGHDLDATVERTGASRYVLDVTSTERDGEAAQCLATARYVAQVRVPTDGQFTLVVTHDGDQVAVVTERGGSATAAAADG